MKVVIVTGASKGIGKSAAQHLLSQGISVVGIARTAAALAALQSEPSPTSAQFIGITGDISDESVQDRAVGVARSLGDIVGIVNNAAIVSPTGPILDATAEQWQRILGINLLAPLTLTAKCIADLKRNGGNVINVTSSTSQAPVPAFGPYGVTKVSLNYVSKAISVEYPEVTCLAFYPGVVDTDMNQDAIDAVAKYAETGNGCDMSGTTKKLAEPISADLPGRIIANLATRASHELTGQYFVYSDDAMAPYST
ncbi:hypothetical protein FBU59_002684 [Linderina macrospora]|uniref:Uncharacterized protein n=1 Tax=Linderina macrospora TaxID=4868 RepID=A0ACC1JAH4_9FUNG|nr:hypothetical protein FBU59_002684 [Linderina macrospora]